MLILLRSMLLSALLAGSIACSTTTVYIVRHGEKVDETDSTDLSPAGHRRARALADTLASKGVDSIFTTPFRRTRQTATPLSQRIGVPIRTYVAAPVSVIVNRVNRLRNKTVLVVGHSNTILEIAQGLGTTPARTRIESGDFDNLLRVRIVRNPFGRSATVTETTYGAPTLP